MSGRVTTRSGGRTAREPSSAQAPNADKRSALVTGGSRGIGASVCKALEASGWTVWAPSRAVLDLERPASVSAFLASISEPVSGLVLNAAINPPGPIGELTASDWTRVQQVNLTSAFAIVSALAPGMADRGFGRVVGISSAYAGRARPGRAAYGASKSGLEALLRGVSVEFAYRGVTANCVAPGFVDTDLTRRNNDNQAIARIIERIPVGRLADPTEIGNAVAFLMSPTAAYITGHTLVVDGGFSCT